MLPRIILHNSVSVNGQTEHFTPDIGLHYELASRWKIDAHLAGSNTIFNPEEEVPPEDEENLRPPEIDPTDSRPLLVVPDSRGRLRNWHVLRKAPYWRDTIALCSKSTPTSYLDYLKERHIRYIVEGDDHVDMRKALEELNSRYGVETVLLDSGGTLNGILLRAGLVDEVSLLVHPCLVGGSTPATFFRGPDIVLSDDVIELRLTHVERVKDDMAWLRYEVKK